jgi:intracellular sulfur oxidation DsrE/DsrF family protein
VIAELRKAGVEVLVCGQALAYKGFKHDEVSEGIKVASAALTVVINKQADGYSYVPAH